MADIPTATIRVSGNRSDGSGDDKSTVILSRIDKNIKKFTESIFKQGRLKQAGLGGGLGGASSIIAEMGGILGLLGGGVITSDLLGKAAGWGVGKAGDIIGAETYGYEKIKNQEGEEYIAKINEKTGDIVDLLTEEEAVQQGILNEQYNIRDEQKVVSEIWDEKKKLLSTTKDWVILSNEIWSETTVAQQEYRDALKEAARLLIEERKLEIEQAKTTGRYSVDPSGGYSDLVSGQSVSKTDGVSRALNYEELGQLANYGYGSAYGSSTSQYQEQTQSQTGSTPLFVELAYQQSFR